MRCAGGYGIRCVTHRGIHRATRIYCRCAAGCARRSGCANCASYCANGWRHFSSCYCEKVSDCGSCVSYRERRSDCWTGCAHARIGWTRPRCERTSGHPKNCARDPDGSKPSRRRRHETMNGHRRGPTDWKPHRCETGNDSWTRFARAPNPWSRRWPSRGDCERRTRKTTRRRIGCASCAPASGCSATRWRAPASSHLTSATRSSDCCARRNDCATRSAGCRGRRRAPATCSGCALRLIAWRHPAAATCCDCHRRANCFVAAGGFGRLRRLFLLHLGRHHHHPYHLRRRRRPWPAASRSRAGTPPGSPGCKNAR